MENDLQRTRPDTLMSELGNWNRQEHKFRELFGDNALNDREFLKMKLECYDSLFRKYAYEPKTRDEQAMTVMLRFQRRKMEKALYSGLLRRMLHRLSSGIKGLLEQRWERQRTQRDALEQQMHALALPQIRQPENMPKQQATVRKMPVARHRDERKTNRMRQHRKKGRSL